MSELEPRAVCMRCLRPSVVCVCDLAVPLATKTRVVILQHPRERYVGVNTVRIASLCLPEAEVHVGVTWPEAKLARFVGDATRPAALLYPGPEAIDVEEHPPAAPITLVVVDGTWWQARKLIRLNPALAALPRYAFRPRVPSQYRIRAEPHDDYVSTIEALVNVLGILEGDPARIQTMLTPFRAMVDRQLAFAANSSGPRHVRKPRPAGAAPRAKFAAFMRERFADLVCVHGEANAWPYGSAQRTEFGDDMVQMFACRVATGEVLHRFVMPRGVLAENTAYHLKVPPEAFTAAVDLKALHREWAAFVRPSDVVCSWGTFSTRLYERAGGSFPTARIDLRDAARESLGQKFGAIEVFLERAHATPSIDAPAESGRGGRRLVQLVSVARALVDAGTIAEPG